MTVPAPHDELCPSRGCGLLCAPTALAGRTRAGTFAKGTSGNLLPMRSLRQIRKYISEQTNGNQDLIDHALRLAGVKPNGEVSYPPNVQARVMIKLLDVVFGREIRKSVEHSGTVTHDTIVRTVAPVALENHLTIEQLRQLREIKLALRPPPDAEDAVFEDVPKKTEEES